MSDYVPEIRCQFGNTRCLCQWCEHSCNNGMNCHECDMEKKQMHDIYLCTGFIGTYPDGMTSDEVKVKAHEYAKKRGWVAQDE